MHRSYTPENRPKPSTSSYFTLPLYERINNTAVATNGADFFLMERTVFLIFFFFFFKNNRKLIFYADYTAELYDIRAYA